MPFDESVRIPPAWLKEDFFTKSLREGMKNPNLLVLSCDIKPATAVGDNYASIMFRAKLNIRLDSEQPPQTLSVVCKTLPQGNFQEMIKEGEVFEKEAHQLGTIMPKINSILKRAIPEEQILCADLIHFATEPEQVIILQDLKELGFSNLDRMGGLDLQASTMVVKALARLHAGSLALLQKHPDLLKKYEECMWTDLKSGDQIKTMLESSFTSMLSEISESWTDFPEDKLARLQNLKEKLWEKLQDALRFDEKSLNVLQHGDSWTNNIMFKKDGNNLTGLRFVDFQICFLNSAAVDLNYFIFTSTEKTVRLEKVYHLLRTYYDAFIKNIKALNVDLPETFTYDELVREFESRAFFGMVAEIMVYPITVTEPKDVMDVNEFFENGDQKRFMYRSKTFEDMFKSTLPHFIKCGVL